jgi:ABC-2 type transport system ATP-binding protein/ribosome-dependent ATPase
MRALEARAVTRRFGDFTAVEGVDLLVDRGEIVGLLGANGAGKTTLMRIVLGLLQPSSGRVALFGSPPSRATRLRIGYVPQNLGLYRDLTVAENLRFAAGVYSVDAAPPPEGTGDVLVGDLPLGMQRRIAFAAALQHSPDLLVLDEPTSGVAPLARARLWERIRAAAADGAAVLVSTHAMDEARQADRLVLMHLGRVVGTGTETDIVAGSSAVVVRSRRWADAFTALEDAGIPASLSGDALRVPGADAQAVAAALTAAGIDAALDTAAATLEEAMVLAGAQS